MFIAKIGTPKFGVLLAAGLFAVSFAPAASAASLVTEAFLANVRPNASFLAQSSSIVGTRSRTDATREFARGEVPEARSLVAALDEADATTRVAAMTVEPEVRTGRSVAVEGSAAVTGAPVAALGQAANGRMALRRQDIAELAGLSGRDLDDAYWAKQLDALSQLAADYRTYAAAGDDPALVALSKRELPKVIERLKLLSKI